MKKLASVEALRENLRGRQLLELIPGRPSLTIDNTVLSPEGAAKMIIGHYGLQTL